MILLGLGLHPVGFLVTLFVFDWTPPRVWNATEYRTVLMQHAYAASGLTLTGFLLSILYWLCTAGLDGSAQGSDHVARVISSWIVVALIPAFFVALFWWWVGRPPFLRERLFGTYIGIFSIWFLSVPQTVCAVALAFGKRDRPIQHNLLSKFVRRILPG